MSGHRTDNVLIKQTTQVVGASATKQAVSNVFSISAEDSKLMKVMVAVTGHSGTVTAILQDSHDGTTYADVASVSVTGDGDFEINHNIYDGTSAPMWVHGRVVVTTAGASGASITACRVTRR